MIYYPEDTECDPEALATGLLHEIGIPFHLNGFQYLREALLLTLEAGKKLYPVTTVLYPRIADRFQTTPTRVERDIRNAIAVAWDRGNLRNFSFQFGGIASTVREKPSNSALIALAVEKLLLQLKAIQ